MNTKTHGELVSSARNHAGYQVRSYRGAFAVFALPLSGARGPEYTSYDKERAVSLARRLATPSRLEREAAPRGVKVGAGW